MTVRKEDPVITVQGLDSSLRGTAVWQGKPCAVRGALPGEQVRLRLPGRDGAFAPAEILRPAARRQQPACPLFGRCGGCALQHLPYAEQLLEKQALVARCLEAVPGATVSPCVGGEPFAWRNKAHLVFAREQGRIRTGFFDEISHGVIPVDACPVHGPWIQPLTAALCRWAEEQKLLPYDPRTGGGTLRFAVARQLGQGLQLTLVSQRPAVPGLRRLQTLLEQDFSPVSLYLNVNNRRDSAVFSSQFRHIAGPAALPGELLGVRFGLTPGAFLQVNTKMAERIFADVTGLAVESGCTAVLDAYSGIGITSMLFAKAGCQVTAVELVPQAAAEARRLATENGLTAQIRTVCGDCRRVLPKLKLPDDTLFFIDPPRRGLGPAVCGDILRFAPKEILYLSCGPEALGADLQRLVRGGYRLLQATPYDLFPQTAHVETLCRLVRAETGGKQPTGTPRRSGGKPQKGRASRPSGAGGPQGLPANRKP